MDTERFIRSISKSNVHYSENEDMRKNTSFKIGGIAPLIVYPDSAAQVSSVIRAANEYGIQYYTLGRGTNLLVRDEGIDFIFIKTTLMDTMKAEGCTLTAGAGCSDSRTACYALENSLTGLEFIHGIPGSIGGACYMNAGAYGSQMSDVVQSVEYVDADGQICRLSGKELKFGYRQSAIGEGQVVCSVTMQLSHADPEGIRSRMNELINRRKASQQLEYPSAGSVFKRPEGYFAGKLIQDCGLKGCVSGGAQVSDKHAGFIINRGGATCKDVLDLIRRIQDEVFEKFGVHLQTEVKII